MIMGHSNLSLSRVDPIKGFNHSRWDIIEERIKGYCLKKEISDFKIEFHHGGFSKS